MPQCSAYGCNNTTSGKNKQEGLGWHRFPEEVNQRKEWLHRVNRKNFHPFKYQKLCGEHFTEECYSDHMSVALMGQPMNKIWVLKEGAIPTKFRKNVDGTWVVGSPTISDTVSEKPAGSSFDRSTRTGAVGRAHTERRLKEKQRKEVSILFFLCTLKMSVFQLLQGRYL